MELPASLEMIQIRKESTKKQQSPYPSSWINRFTTWVDSLRGPALLYYLAAIALLSGILFAFAWWEGSFRPGIIGFGVVITGSSVYYLAMLHFLDKVAADAVAKFCPTMGASEQQATELIYKLTHMPSRTVNVLTLTGFALALLIISGVEHGQVRAEISFFGQSMAVQLYWRVVLILDQMLFWNLIYHTVHQLRIVHEIYTKYAKIDIFNLTPLYAFSRLTAYTAVGKLLIAFLWVATFPWISSDYVVISSWLIAIVAALAGFILPLLGIHRRLVEEKQHWKVDVGQSLKTSFAHFHQSVAERKTEEIELFLKVIEGVKSQQAMVEQIPTWPWQPGTIRGLTTTVLVPIFLWLVLRVLERLVAF